MFERLGHLIAKRKKAVLSLFLLATVLAGGIGSQVFSRFDSGATQTPTVIQPRFGNISIRHLK